MRAIVLAATAVVTAVAVLMAACGGSSPETASTSEAHREPEVRLVVLSPALAIIAQDIGLEDLIVGRHDYDLALADSIPKVGDHLALDYEAILRQRPTHIIAEDGLSVREPRLASVGEDRGFAIVEYPMRTLDDIAIAADDLYLDFIVGGLPEPARGATASETQRATGIDFVDPASRFKKPLPSARLARAFRGRPGAYEDIGRVLLLGAAEPPSAVGPGSFHHELLTRMGGQPAITEGGPWQELDAESLLRLAPDAIVLFAPGREDADFGRAASMVAALETPAAARGRLGVVTHRFALMPATSLANVADELRAMLDAWRIEAKSSPVAPVHSGP